MLRSGKMQYRNSKNFIFWGRNRLIGGMHKTAHRRQMFLRQNHTLFLLCFLNKISVYNGNGME